MFDVVKANFSEWQENYGINFVEYSGNIVHSIWELLENKIGIEDTLPRPPKVATISLCQ